MKTFKHFINEENEKGNYSFFHPMKGMYKLAYHKDQDVYHLHNKFGDLTHTFSGHMTPKEISSQLKDDHDMIAASKLDENILNELTKVRNVSYRLNPHRGGYNEALVAKELHGGWIDKEHKAMADYHGGKLAEHDQKNGTKEVQQQKERASEQAKIFLEHAKKKGYSGIKKVAIVSKPGEIEKKLGIKATQQENPTDIGVEFKSKPKNAPHSKLGLSAKSSAKGSIGFHNGGTKEIGSFLKDTLGGKAEEGQLHPFDIHGHVNKRYDEFANANDLPTVRSKAVDAVTGPKYLKNGQDNPKYRNNPLYKRASEHATQVNSEVRDILHKGYDRMAKSHHEELKQHLLSTYIKGNTDHALPYVKVTGIGGGTSKAKAVASDPSDNETYHKIKNAKRFSFVKGGGGYIKIRAHSTNDAKDEGEKIFGLQIKPNNGPLTSMKIGAQP